MRQFQGTHTLIITSWLSFLVFTECVDYVSSERNEWFHLSWLFSLPLYLTCSSFFIVSCLQFLPSEWDISIPKLIHSRGQWFHSHCHCGDHGKASSLKDKSPKLDQIAMRERFSWDCCHHLQKHHVLWERFFLLPRELYSYIQEKHNALK